MAGFFKQARKLLSRGEVDDLDRGTSALVGHRAEVEKREAEIVSLRRHAADTRHPELSAAIARRNRAR